MNRHRGFISVATHLFSLLIVVFTAIKPSEAAADAVNKSTPESRAYEAKVRTFVQQVLKVGPALNESELGAQNETQLVRAFKVVVIKRTSDVTRVRVALHVDGTRIRDERMHRTIEHSASPRWDSIEIDLIERNGRFVLSGLAPARYLLRTKKDTN